ncbi:carboxymuconolactone decarboxylase family protein [Rhodococcus sp. F64268]|uniref:carboxymuconolactone decarboxylase family protein n=1 Tax=Rhodococcus sp. F64268 TaxID=2926402 RepID=UPI001FF61C2E|nr:carboxymuconolactone decarboxylase family protein [Rhodococcus sp. F64268]MCK0090812.1 carboxymuconolactone decarboxylase family protein [Rhodococcus sp. F64268]
MAVVPPLPADQWDERVDSALRGLMPRHMRNPKDAGTAMATLVRHPDLTKAFLGFSVHLLFRSTLPPRLREMTILRVAQVYECEYERSHHILMAEEEGALTRPEIKAALAGTADDEFENRLLAAVDELHQKAALSEQTWNALGEKLSEQQRMDFIFTVGGYGLLAMAYNTFGIEFESER